MTKRNHRLKKPRQNLQLCPVPRNITLERADRILNRLNSLNSADEIMSALKTYSGQKVLGMRIAQRILKTRAEVGKFDDLKQIALVPGIGLLRFSAILQALCDSN